MADTDTIGWDLGGAHIKRAMLDTRGSVIEVQQISCPLWRGMDRFNEVISDSMADAPGHALHAVTMTGELADLFPDRDTGVRTLVDAVRRYLPPQALHIYAGQRGFFDADTAQREPACVASVNWLATATYLAARLGDCILIDIGSTTTDIVPCAAGRVAARGLTDHQRLAAHELCYQGVVRTPVAAVARRVPWDGAWVDLMTESFATSADVYRLTGDLPENADLIPSADRAPKSLEASARRLARMLGLDYRPQLGARLRAVANEIKRQQVDLLANALGLVASRTEVDGEAPIVGAGSGRFLAAVLAARCGRGYVDFADLFEHHREGAWDAADCAPAVAVAHLVRDCHA